MYLLAKFTIFFFISATLGFVLGSWWSRRNLLVTAGQQESLHASANRPEQANWALLWQRLEAIPKLQDVNLDSVLKRCDEIVDAVSKVPRTPQCDLSGVEKRLDSLHAAVTDIPIPLSPRSVDLQPVLEKLELIQQDFDRTTR